MPELARARLLIPGVKRKICDFPYSNMAANSENLRFSLYGAVVNFKRKICDFPYILVACELREGCEFRSLLRRKICDFPHFTCHF